MHLEIWLVYLAAAIGVSLTPGPNGLLSLSHGAVFGFRATVYTALGGISGFFLVIAASLAGLGSLLAASERAFMAAKWIGAVYLIYLGVRMWRSPAPVVAETKAAGGLEGRPAKMFRQGFLVAVSNPKALIFFAAFLPQFIVPGVPYLIQLAVFGGTFAVVEFLYELLLASLAHRIAPWLARHGRWFNRAAGGTFVGLGAALTSVNR